MRGARRSAAILLGVLLAGAPAHANSGGRVGRSGRQNQTCNECHSGGVRPDVALQVPDRVATGETVVLRFTVHAGSPAGRAAGFNVAVEGGALVAIPGQGARVASGEITHSEPKDNDETRTAGWDFQWIAPATPGTYRLWGAGNSVNGNGQSSGDKADALVRRVDVVTTAATETPTATASPVPPTRTATPTATPSATGTNPPTSTASPTATPTAVDTVSPPPTDTAPAATDTPTIPAAETPSPGAAAATETAPATPASPPRRAPCAGDCDGDGAVAINELVTGVGIALGGQPLAACASADQDGNGQVAINELIAAVNHALGAC